jgi:Recombination endonuclease VII
MSASQLTPCKRGHIAERNKRRECVECKRECNRTWYSANLKTERARSAKARAANMQKYREFKRKADGLPEPTRTCPERCECCGRSRGKKALALDHDHVSGRFRGWLCHLCNTSLGMLGDSYHALQRMVQYLNRADLT